MSKHITEKQRYAISKMLQVPMSKKDIAEAIGVDRSNIYREIKRNCGFFDELAALSIWLEK